MTSRITTLKKRAQMLQETRSFFAKRNIIEVDCPLIGLYPNLDENIGVIQTNDTPPRYLHTSPEYPMKRLLAEGLDNIYQLSHVFRKNELGPFHNPEFTLVEWYRKNITYTAFLQEVLDYLSLFLGVLPFSEMTYRELFQHFVDIDYLKATKEDLHKVLEKHNVDIKTETASEDVLLDIILTHIIEPQLGHGEFFVINGYPAAQAALAKTYRKDDEMVAERFEVYYKGTELTNGYHELTDPIEQRRRFENSEKYKQQNLPIDEKFLQALEKGIGDCYGVAVGFDRLLMLQLNKKNIHDVLPFSWDS